MTFIREREGGKKGINKRWEMKGERRKRGPHPGECHPKYDFYKGKERGNKYGKLRGNWGKEGDKRDGKYILGNSGISDANINFLIQILVNCNGYICVILEVCSENSTKYVFLHDYDIHIGRYPIVWL